MLLSLAITTSVAACIGGLVATAIERRRAAKREQQIRDYCLAEYLYWSRDDREKDDTDVMIELGAIGAASNLLAAVAGRPAPWHVTPVKPIQELQ